MTRYRARAVLLLFGVLYLTACSSWQSIGPVSPSRFIELDQPERVRVYMRGGGQVELESPSVEGDALVAPNVSMPLADIIGLEVHGFSAGRTVLVVLGTAATGIVAVIVWLVIEATN
mgnify:CR=1 FL=1